MFLNSPTHKLERQGQGQEDVCTRSAGSGAKKKVERTPLQHGPGAILEGAIGLLDLTSFG